MHKFFTMGLASLVALSFVSITIAEDSNEKGFVSMFNGKDLTGWKVNENKESVRVEDGLLVTNGKRAHAFYVGDDGKADFTNFHFKCEVRTEDKSNSGIYFHTRYLEEGWPDRGYEAQVNNTHRDPKKTGGLYNVQDNADPPAKDGEWFTYEIIVKGQHILVKVNDKTISDYTEPDDLKRPNRQLSHGLMALQAHDPISKVSYRNLRIKKLDD